MSGTSDLRDVLRVKPKTQVNLSEHRSRRQAWLGEGGGQGEDWELLGELSALQDRLWAEAKHPVLVVLQGIDASGKDGAVRHVMAAFNPMGCEVSSFKVPTPEEASHDFLWRIHKRMPAKGVIGVFNRVALRRGTRRPRP